MRVRVAVLLFVVGCGPKAVDKLDTNPDLNHVVSVPVIDLRADVNRDGALDAADDADEDTWDSAHGAIFLANIDDDTTRCPQVGTDMTLPLCNDADDDVINGDDDLLDLAPLSVAPWINATDDMAGVLTAVPAGHVKIFKKTDSGWALADRLSGAELRAGVELRLEGIDIVRDRDAWDGYVNVTLSLEGSDTPASDTVRMREAPVVLFHHLEAPMTSYVTRVAGDPWSSSFVSSLRTILAATPEHAPLVEIPEDDIWTEDFFETGYMSMPAAGGAQHVIRTAYRSASVWDTGDNPLRPAGQVVFTRFRGRDGAGLQAFTRAQDPDSESLNSYGNTETIPPYTNGSESYPLGRILRGDIPSFAPDPVMSKVLESQAVQPQVYIDTSWLLVGHVDETLSFLKAPSPRGWVLLVNDPTLARSMLQAAADSGDGGTQMFIGKSWYDDMGGATPATATVTQVLADTDVMGRSATAASEIDAQLSILKSATGLTDAEIIRVPFLHHTSFGEAIAYQPGFVNGYVAGEHDFVAPDPFGPMIDGKDIFKAYFEEKLQAIGYTVRWIDDWDLYHTSDGEVHCGTNAARKVPDAKWWEGGR